MLCQVCGKQNYSLKITRIRNGAAEELKVCEECAVQISPYHAKIAKKKQHDKQAVENLLKDLLAQKEAGGAAEAGTTAAEGETLACQSCGLEFAHYKQTYMLGCPECYENFGEKLLADIRRIHGATQHVGGRATSQNRLLDIQARTRALETELRESVEKENFERAAELRDEIRQLQEAQITEEEE